MDTVEVKRPRGRPRLNREPVVKIKKQPMTKSEYNKRYYAKKKLLKLEAIRETDAPLV